MAAFVEAALVKKMLFGVDSIKIGLARHLVSRLEPEHGQENAFRLAGVIIGGLFSEAPVAPLTPDVERFLNSGREVSRRRIV